MKLPPVFNKFLELLRVKTPIGGLEISDSAIRLAVPGVDRWDVYSQRLPLGVVEDGVLKDPVRFRDALAALKKSAHERYGNKKIPVTVSLVSSQIYTQAFPLPVVHESEVDKVIGLNLKTISPVNYDDVYAGWQYVKKDLEGGHFEVLGAFLRRHTVEELEHTLGEAGFRPLALEPRSLSLARLIRNLGVGVTGETPLAVLSVDDEGINFLVIKNGQMYFEYTELWRNLYEPGKSISIDEFKSAVKRSVQQLVNFYSQRWPDPLGEFLIVAPSLVGEVEKILKDDFSFRARELSFTQTQNIGGEWFAAIGAAWRGSLLSHDDTELSLLGHTGHHVFARERFVDFLLLWRVIIPVALTITLLILVTTDVFIIRQGREVQATATSRLSEQDRTSVLELESQARKFNADISLIQAARTLENSKSPLIKDIFERATSTKVVVGGFRLQGENISLSGIALSEDNIIAFKNSLIAGGYQNIDLPLSGIQKGVDNYNFSMNFSRAPANTP